MKEEIISHLNDPRQLEKIYRANKQIFKREFRILYPELKGNVLADFWNERLNYESDDLNWTGSKEFLFVIIASLLAGVIAKLPAIFSINEDFFYPRNIGFIVFPVLIAYFSWKNGISKNKIAFIVGSVLLGLVFINLIPEMETSDTLFLSCIHLILFLWSILGVSFVGKNLKDLENRLSYLRYNGDLIVMTTLILISGAILTGITIGLFSLIGLNIEEFYFNYIAVFGLAAAPVVGTYLTQKNPQLVGKVSPVIARIFSPLVLVMLVVYLLAIIYSGKDPYNDREFLLIFNALLVGVMAIIFFSVAETSKTGKNQAETWILFLLSVITVLVNLIALSAILFRISEGGITPNRAAVLGSNVLILINLLLVTRQFIQVLWKKIPISGVRNSIASYLPIYILWTIIVTFLFPLLFDFQ